MCRARVYVEIVGNVDPRTLESILQPLRDVYCVTNVDAYVELVVYGSRSEKLARLEREARELGVVAFGDFKTLHEAWRGYPRIHVSLEDLADLSEDVVKALVAHEAMHSVLHGTLASYLVYIPPQMIERAIDGSYLEKLYAVTYLLASAIKDLEVHREMKRRGLVKYLELYARFCDEQLRSTCCKPGCSAVEIANALKLLTPFHVLDREPGTCCDLMRSDLFRKLVDTPLDRVHEVAEKVFEFARSGQ